MTNKLILTAALGILLGGCAKDETTPAFADNPLPAGGVIRIYPDVDGLQTRAEGRNTAKLQQYPLYLNIEGGITQWTYSSGEGWTITGPHPLLWDYFNKEQKVVALSMVNQEINIPTEGNPTVIQFATDQSAPDGSGITETDYLCASSLVKPSGPNPANDIYYDPDRKGLVIRMKHGNAKLKIKIDLPPAFNDPGKGNATVANPLTDVAVKGTGTTGMIYAGAYDKLEAGSPGSITPFMDSFTPGSETDPSAPDARGATVWYECILLAQTVPLHDSNESLSVSFRINGKDYTWTSPDAVTFGSGKVYTLPLSVQSDVTGVIIPVPGATWEPSGEPENIESTLSNNP